MIRPCLTFALGTILVGLAAVPAHAGATNGERAERTDRKEHTEPVEAEEKDRSASSETAVTRPARQGPSLPHPFREQVQWLEARV